MLRIKRSELKPGEKKKVTIGNEEVILLYLGGGKYYAFQSRCPHLGCDLYKVGVVIREELVCQCHFTHFSINDGRAIKGATKKPLKLYRVQVDGEDIIVES
ncbi:Rieske (2Fe-2S) protein [Sulfolobus acidocaldarius]|uniref:Conserved protein n=4 Tax=Sulfolobus acidocaldarius TaxID=2285 RepID=Q4JC70_SULAC|nr:Rieske (2Fe-2S) protein [Sulfolobus acidocaldarius]AAY79609.1 conserved protein [Sulfolobus acidocaldarius DSM 639]AGE70163.1 hypothetical protein SacN8_00910 [Sulfolobus acidocaldarius N8]AGE72438.1 hypothetical protein SacRon12I_00910 [Sulfolobus acidocaldarius Ron12/I]ALU29426.1 Rieske (2Fe-2S) protein [Sulfolobus acidocaldarius]ALU32154.1 Rieske (2Fe-2S) protein [Sulfolobus acidocaldarius]